MNIDLKPLTSPDYDPPYDSPIEDLFAWHLIKYLPPHATLVPQVEVTTQCGTYRIDFVCTSGGRTVGFECDGQKYHDEVKDEWRDALIMGTHRVNAVYRIAGRNIFHQIERSLYLIGRDEPNLFGERGRIQLRILGEADMIGVDRFEDVSFLGYRWFPERLAHLLDDQDLIEQASRDVTLRLTKSTDRRFYGREPEWLRKVRFARLHRGKTLSEIIQLYPY
jgi:hypothetical protein